MLMFGAFSKTAKFCHVLMFAIFLPLDHIGPVDFILNQKYGSQLETFPQFSLAPPNKMT